MAKFLFVSKGGDSLALAFRVKQEGNDVLTWIKSPKHKHMFDGLLKKVEGLNKGLSKDRIAPTTL